MGCVGGASSSIRKNLSTSFAALLSRIDRERGSRLVLGFLSDCFHSRKTGFGVLYRMVFCLIICILFSASDRVERNNVHGKCFSFSDCY